MDVTAQAHGVVRKRQPIREVWLSLAYSQFSSALLALLCAAFIIVQCNAQLAINAPWPCFGGNVQHTGMSEFNGPQSGLLAVAWEQKPMPPLDPYAYPAVDASGNVYVVGGGIYGFDATGRRLWSFSPQLYVQRSSPAISAHRSVYVGSSEGKLYALDSTTGAVRWSFSTEGGAAIYSSPVLDADNTVYFGGYDNYVYAVNGTSGGLVWRYHTAGGVFSSPALGPDGTVYVGSLDHNVYALHGSTGALKWNFTTGGGVYSSAVVSVSEDVVYIGSSNGLYKSLASTGELVWLCSTCGTVSSVPVLGKNGTVYFTSVDNHFHAVSASGVLLWSLPSAQYVMNAVTVDAAGVVYVGTGDSDIYALNGATGEVLWSYNLGDIAVSMVIGGEGLLHVVGQSSTVYVIWASSGHPSHTASPTPSHVSSVPALIGGIVGGGGGFVVVVAFAVVVWKCYRSKHMRHAANTSKAQLTKPHWHQSVSSSQTQSVHFSPV